MTRIGMAAVGVWMALAAGGLTAAEIRPEAVRIARSEASQAEVFALRDTEMTVKPSELLLDITPEELARLVPGDEVQLSVTVFLVKWNGQNILVDAGVGQAQGGVMIESLALAGVKPEEVNAVLVSHLHFDHVGGLAHEGRAIFPNATIYLTKAELDTWTTEEGMAKLPDAQQPRAEMAGKALAPYLGRIAAMEMEKEYSVYSGEGWFAGLTSGHTPGHAVYTFGYFTENQTAIVFIGDIAHIAEVQTPRPRTTIVFDVEPDAARFAREKLFETLAARGMLLAGPHFPFPSAGTLEKEGDGYRFKPVEPAP